MDYAAFVAAYPEFRTASSTLVQSKLEAAARRVDPVAFGDSYGDAVGLMAAHLLWTSPFGASLRLDGGADDSSRYMKEFARLRREVCPSFMLT